ncbi:tetratricopeptide repeat protein [Arenimonas sp.]|uniref:tetratricopeptide repeat protein n=1 Tax=Arenimonas sp. TaxID=1872635 RepID=UPI0035B354C6
MTVFLLASLAVVLVLAAFALRPLWTGARRSALALALALGVGTAGLYALLGSPDALDPAQVKAPETLDEAIVQLERRLADEPGSVEGWVLLGRSRAAQQDWPAAAEAFGKAQALLPEEPDLMVELADARMRAAADGRFPADAVALLERAVTLRPDHQRALFYLGAQQLQAGRPAEAADTWDRLLPLVDASTAKALRPQLDMAREQAGLPPLEPAPEAAPGPSLAVTVELDPGLAGQLPAGATLYVFARTLEGGLPVAVKRLPAGDFPVTVGLSDADGLMPAQKLSAQARVQLMARISRSGDAGASPGDLEADAIELDVADGAKASLVIAKVVR